LEKAILATQYHIAASRNQEVRGLPWNYKLQNTNYKQITNPKLQITNKRGVLKWTPLLRQKIIAAIFGLLL